MADEELNIRLKADTEEFKASLDDAKGHVRDSSEEMMGSLKELAGAFGLAFSVEKLIEFGKEAFTSFAEVERGMDVLGVQVRQHGQSWDALKGSVDKFLVTQAELFGVSKEKLLEALNAVQLKTGDLSASLGILNEAGRLSAFNYQDLNTNARMLSLAYEGNQRGLLMLGRQLNLTKDESKDAGVVFAKLEKVLKGVDTVLDDTKGQMNATKAAWGEFSEMIGRLVTPAVVGLSKALRFVISEFKTLMQISGISATMMAGDEQKVTQAVKVETDKQLAIHAAANQKRVNDAKKVTAEVKKEEHDLTRDIAGLSETVAKNIGEAAQKGGDAWKAAGKNIAKYVIDALGDVLIQMGVADFAKAAANALDPLTMAAAPGEFAAGSMLEAAGGGLKGVAAAFLAEGGIVRKPTLAVVGEAGPEAVIPLNSTTTNLGGDITFHRVEMVFPGIKSISDLGGDKFHKTAARQLAERTQDLNQRKGNRST